MAAEPWRLILPASMDSQRPVSPPFGVGLATLAPTLAEAARLRDQHVVPVVADANALLAEAHWRSRVLVPTFRPGGTTAWPRPSGLSRAVAAGAARLYAKSDLPGEIESHLPTVAERWGVSVEDLRGLLATDYLTHLRLVDLLGVVLDEPGLDRVLARDPDDEPTARLVRLLDPSLLLTRDRDLIDHGFGDLDRAEWRDWTQAAGAVAAASFNAQLLGGFRLTVALGGASGSAVVDLGRAHPRVAFLALLASAVGLGVLIGSNRWAAARDVAKGTLAAFWEAYGDELTFRLQAATTANAALVAYRNRHTGPGSDVALVARTLAIAPVHGLLVSEIEAIHPLIGASRVREILELPAFVPTDRWRWALGRLARP